MAQAPQLAPSDIELTQPLGHASSPAWHMQVPLQTCPALQATPHALQLATSVVVLEHAWPQAESGAGQLHDPLTHVWVPPQTMPQAPQLAASVFGLTHIPLPQGAVPTGH